MYQTFKSLNDIFWSAYSNFCLSETTHDLFWFTIPPICDLGRTVVQLYVVKEKKMRIEEFGNGPRTL